MPGPKMIMRCQPPCLTTLPILLFMGIPMVQTFRSGWLQHRRIQNLRGWSSMCNQNRWWAKTMGGICFWIGCIRIEMSSPPAPSLLTPCPLSINGEGGLAMARRRAVGEGDNLLQNNFLVIENFFVKDS